MLNPEDYLLKIKQAVPGAALIFGNCVPMPLMVKVEEAQPALDSRNCKVSEEWYKYECLKSDSGTKTDK